MQLHVIQLLKIKAEGKKKNVTNLLMGYVFWNGDRYVVFFTDTVDQKYEDESEEGSLQSVDGGYKGIHIRFPLTRTDLDALIDTFRKKKVSKIDMNYYVYRK
jgi:hypothetical protein